MLRSGVRTTVARWLEHGVMSGPCARALASAHARFARGAVARPLLVPAAITTVTVGGATLGGSGKTRVALACVRELASLGVSVVLVGHAYRARPRTARVVAPTDPLDEVGDEALACARALAADPRCEGSRVVVGPTRQEAVDLAVSLLGSHLPAAIVIDGPLQLAPMRSSLAILALDAGAPWGAGDVAPAGDLRAPRHALLAHADHLATVDAMPRGATVAGKEIDLAELASSRIGLFTAIARPDRLERALARAGLAPSVVVRAADHGPVSAANARQIDLAEVDIWLATTKCALHLDRRILRRPLAILDGSTALPPPIALALALCVRSVGVAPTSVA